MSRISVYLVVGICLLNLNGWGYLFLDREQMFSPVLALAVVLLLWRLRGSLSRSGLLYVGWILLFVVIGALLASAQTGDVKWALAVGAIGNALVVVAISSWIVLAPQVEIARLLTFAFACTALSAILVLCSPFLDPFVVNPVSDAERYAGFFGNPNEAGEVCLIGLCLAFDVRGRGGRWGVPVVVCVLVVAAMSTFSKATAVGLLLLGLLAVYRRSGLSGTAIVGGLLIFLATSISLPEDGHISVLDIDLEPMQALRVEQLISTFNGNVDQNTTTNRTVVWSAAAERMESGGAVALLVGNGLGAFRVLEGGLWENGEWKGVHNTWLMILGEGGIIAFTSIAVSYLLLLRRSSLLLNRHFFPLAYCFALIVDTLSSHNVLELKFHAVGLAIALGFVGRQEGVLPVRSPMAPGRIAFRSEYARR